MKTQRRQVRVDRDYECEICMEFSDLNLNKDVNEPVDGLLKITLSENIPYPVEVGIEDIETGNGNATYVDFRNQIQSIQGPNDYPIVFQFTTNPSPEKGGKWYFYKTADWTPDSNIEPFENPEFIKHHIGIPSAQKIRLIHRILKGTAGEETINALVNLYSESRTEAASDFSEDIKVHVGFESRAKIQDFLIGKTGMNRSRSDTVNKVAKQLTKEEYRHRVNSLEEAENMVNTLNELENFPDIRVEEVFKRVEERSDEEELEVIAAHLGLDDYSDIV